MESMINENTDRLIKENGRKLDELIGLQTAQVTAIKKIADSMLRAAKVSACLSERDDNEADELYVVMKVLKDVSNLLGDALG